MKIEIHPSELSNIHFSEQPIQEGTKIIGWHVYVRDAEYGILSGGTHMERAVARRIATSEFIERRVFIKTCEIGGPAQLEKFKLNDYPSTCGFACGFNSESTMLRSICEGLERWGVSQWIDKKYFINKIPSTTANSIPLSLLGNHLKSKFLTCHFFQKELTYNNLLISESGNFSSINGFLNIFLGETSEGMFMGSRVTLSSKNSWEHEIVEAFRNWENSKLVEMGVLKPKAKDLYLNRVCHFGKNKDKAWRQIPQSESSNWPNPEILISEKVDIGLEGVFVWRTLFKNYVHWDSGAIDRFVV